ncbi:MAG TPA: IS200/IS605 family transposase [Ktedonobacterales bacterium]|nr:IS200/IS605 family transposase [Ktedonobacterales bacterium]
MTKERVYYHVVFTVSRGRPGFLNPEIDAAFKALVREIAHTKGWLLIELETMPNHVHLLLEKPPWKDLSQIMQEVKGISSRRLQQRFSWLVGELDSGHFWTRHSHYERHTDASLATVQAYISNQRRAGGLEP